MSPWLERTVLLDSSVVVASTALATGESDESSHNGRALTYPDGHLAF